MDITHAERTVLDLHGHEQDSELNQRMHSHGDALAERMQRLEATMDRDGRRALILRSVSRPDRDNPLDGRLCVEDDGGDTFFVYDVTCWFNGTCLFIEGYEKGPDGQIVRVRWTLS